MPEKLMLVDKQILPRLGCYPKEGNLLEPVTHMLGGRPPTNRKTFFCLELYAKRILNATHSTIYPRLLPWLDPEVTTRTAAGEAAHPDVWILGLQITPAVWGKYR